MKEGVIEIIIKDKTSATSDAETSSNKQHFKMPGSVGSAITQTAGWGAEKMNDAFGLSIRVGTFKKMASSGYDLLMKGMNFAHSNIGNMTGNYVYQQNVQTVSGHIMNVANLGLSTAAAFVALGPVGGAISAVVSGVSIITNKAMEVHKISLQTKAQNQNIDLLRERAGLNSTTNGSRSSGEM